MQGHAHRASASPGLTNSYIAEDLCMCICILYVLNIHYICEQSAALWSVDADLYILLL